MSYLALYRKYRPSSFFDLVGQNETVNIIKNEILHNRISHAYLFSGPRGTGKTSTAKIIAKMINCKNLSNDGIPCGKCECCVNFSSSSDIIEIDAASNNGVDEIRDLRDKVNLVPTYGRYKIYIIDEVHMLTTQAFNALLKTLEEPPSHIVFILATTEFYKIPVTVVSRCQKFQFLKFSYDDIVSRLSFIAKNEKISVDNNVLYEIARLSDGGMRDAINLLDQLSSLSSGKINVDDLFKIAGVVSYKDFSKLLYSIKKNDVEQVVSFVESLNQNGKNLEQFLADFLLFIKDLLIFDKTHYVVGNNVDNNLIFEELLKVFSSSELYDLIILLNDLSVRIKTSSFSKILLITELIRFCDKFGSKNKIEFEESKFAANKSDTNNIHCLSSKINNDVYIINDKEKMVRINNAFATASKEFKELFVEKWKYVLEKLSDSTYVLIAGMMNDVEVMVVGSDYLLFVAKYDSLVDRLFEHIKIIEQLLKDVYHHCYKVVFLANDEWAYEKSKYINSIKNGKKYELIRDDVLSHNENDDQDIEKIVSIFGNDIVSYE